LRCRARPLTIWAALFDGLIKRHHPQLCGGGRYKRHTHRLEPPTTIRYGRLRRQARPLLPGRESCFTTANGGTTQPGRAAAVDATAGTLTAWNPNLNSWVHYGAVSNFPPLYLGERKLSLEPPPAEQSGGDQPSSGFAFTAWDLTSTDLLCGRTRPDETCIYGRWFYDGKPRGFAAALRGGGRQRQRNSPCDLTPSSSVAGEFAPSRLQKRRVWAPSPRQTGGFPHH